MSAGSPHGYDTRSWSPVTGCSKVSAGCAHCWAEEYSRRMGWPWRVTLHPERLAEPLKWRKPQVVAVCFMGDLFHEAVTDEFIARVLDKTYQTPQHTYLILTKRPKRMRDFMLDNQTYMPLENALAGRETAWPQANLFLGVSVEDQATADARIPLLLRTPAKGRWVSYEPALGAVDFAAYLPRSAADTIWPDGPWLNHRGIDGLVVGGESGPHHRPCDPAWIQSIADQCNAAGMPCYVKQASHRYPGRQGDIPDALWAVKEVPW